MHFLRSIGFILLATAATAMTAHVGRAQAAPFECTALSSPADDEAPFAGRLGTPAAKAIEPVQAEAACRSAVRADPVNPALIFLLGRALTLGNKRLEAIRSYLDAADRGHAGAMNDLGGMFEYGIGVPANLATALVWYERAAELGHSGAMTHLGQLNEDGIGVPQDFANARLWYEKAAVLGNAAAMDRLANLLKEGREGAPNPAAAASWYLKAAELGLARAMNSLGELNEHGNGVPQDYRNARKWYRQAADLGDADAMGNLGALLENGRGGAQDLDSAREWYLKGAARNGRVAMRNLAAMLENGTPKNLSEAKLWYERAAALDYPPALNDLGRLHLVGAGVPQSYMSARNLFERAANLGNANAMNNLAMLYLNGRGVQRDLSLARTWLERAILLNNAEAKENLKRLEQAGLLDGAQIAARRASCMETCGTLHRSYVRDACDRHSVPVDPETPERLKCVFTSLTMAKQCRDSCREWASTSLSDNKCVICFQSLVDCTASAGSREGRSDDQPPRGDSNGCLGSLAACTANCSGPMAR